MLSQVDNRRRTSRAQGASISSRALGQFILRRATFITPADKDDEFNLWALVLKSVFSPFKSNSPCSIFRSIEEDQ